MRKKSNPKKIGEKKAIPQRNISADELIHGTFPPNSPHNSFFRDMQKYVITEGEPVAFEPFNVYPPTYDQMDEWEQAWYFYWRSQMRQGNYLKTDLGYIYLFVYEIICNIGWKTPQEGYDYLAQIVLNYKDTFPTLLLHVPDWAFDFAESHGLEHTLHLETDLTYLTSLTKINILVEQYADDVPLTLPFAIIDALCNYSIVQSAFYNAGNQLLMHAMLPMVLNMTDIILRDQAETGFLQYFGPVYPKKQGYYTFKNALCPYADKKVNVSVREYSTNQRLREHITELMRYTEHAMVKMEKRHDRKTVSHEIENIISSFFEFANEKMATGNKEVVDSHTPKSNKTKKKQKTQKTTSEYRLFHASFLKCYKEDTFFIDMYNNASIEINHASYVPFDKSNPTYKSMITEQRAWYFYWRSQVRKGNYLDTDLAYILLYLYEIINGAGWKNPHKGYEYLLTIMSEYQNKFPDLKTYLPDWIFDFAQLHDLKHRISYEKWLLHNWRRYFIPRAKTDMLLEYYAKNGSLKLPFELIETLCDQIIEDSKFYKSNKALMHEAIPRAVALADAFLRKKTKKGLLQTYVSDYLYNMSYTGFSDAPCISANKIIYITAKEYSDSSIREYITQLVRYSENVLREIKGYRGRLTKVSFEGEIAILVKAFLKREYGGKPEELPRENVEITLNFDDIAVLREQSDIVRAALEVKDTVSIETEFEFETEIRNIEIKEILTLFDVSALSDEFKEFIECLTPLQQKALYAILTSEHPNELEQIAEEAMTLPHILLDEINETAMQILGDLIVESDQEPRILDEYIPLLKKAIT